MGVGNRIGDERRLKYGQRLRIKKTDKVI